VQWEAHSSFMASIQGRGRVIGDVLFIGPSVQEKPGTFIGDFLDKLNQLPPWSRTEFYCERAHLYRCDEGRRLMWDEIAAVSPVAANNGRTRPKGAEVTASEKPGDLIQPTSFSLWRHEITRNPDGALQWKGRLGSRSIQEGKAFILNDILFLEQGKQKPCIGHREEFAKHLRELPSWQETTYFATQAIVRRCPVPQDSSAVPKTPRPEARAAVLGLGLFKAIRIIGKGLLAALTWAWKRLWQKLGSDHSTRLP